MFSISSSKCDARLGGGLFKGVQVHHHHVDGLDAVLGHRAAVLGIGADVQDAAVNLGVQGLHPAVQHLGEAGQLGNVFHLNAGIAQQFGGAAGRDQFHSHASELAGQTPRFRFCR